MMKHFTPERKTWLPSAMMMAMIMMGGNAQAQTPTVVEQGVATGIFYAFYVGERDMDYLPVSYAKYSDGTIVLNRFVNGKADLKLQMGELDEYNRYFISIEDCAGVGYNDTFTYEGYEYWPFAIYRFEEPAVIGEDQMEFLFMDGTTYYDTDTDTVVLDYTSAVDADEYMLLIDLSVPFEGDVPVALTAVRAPQMGQRYDLSGRRMMAHHKGLGVVDGQLRFVK